MGKPSNWVILKCNKEEIRLMDLGPHDEHLTVINDAENVIELLRKGYGMGNDTKVVSIMDEEETILEHKDGEFTGFG